MKDFMPGLKAAIQRADEPDIEESIRWHNELWKRMHQMPCQKAAYGWKCRRGEDHDGPCAAEVDHSKIIVVWQDFIKRETVIYTFDFEDVPVDIYLFMHECHGHIDRTGSIVAFAKVHSFLASKEDFRIEGPYKGEAVVIVSGII